MDKEKTEPKVGKDWYTKYLKSHESEDFVSWFNIYYFKYIKNNLPENIAEYDKYWICRGFTLLGWSGKIGLLNN